MPDKLVKKVKKIEKQFNQIAENLIDAIYIKDAKTLKFQYITPSFEK